MRELRAFFAGIILASAVWGAVYSHATAEHASFILDVARGRR